jgi:hypothetical protein
MSGFGRMAGVDTVFAMVVDPPGGRFRVTVGGVTPGSAAALAAIAMVDVSIATAHMAAMPGLAPLMVIRPFTSEWGHRERNRTVPG